MPRIVSPPLDQLSSLRTPLNDGEQEVLEFLLQHTSEEWEIYIQPHLNGLRPDFVLLHPRIGIAVFEVKDWNLSAVEYSVRSLDRQPPVLMGRRDGRSFSREDDNPIEKLFQYEREIHELYCPRLDARAGRAVITAGLIFSSASTEEARHLCRPMCEYHGMLRYPRYYPISGMDALRAGAIDTVFPEAARSQSKYMTPDLAQDLRSWLVEPSFAAEQRRPLEIDATQRQYVMSRTSTGYRRIKGPAGSGKSMVLAGRAAQLASEGKDVLVVTFNITLLNYLRDLAVRWPTNATNVRRSVTWLNFHAWCKRVCLAAGRMTEYNALWADTENDAIHERVLNESLSQLVAEVLDSGDADRVDLYDAVLVDEGQDFLPEWWSALRKVCRPNAEMLLVADQTQDVYGRARAWTEQVMSGAGFSGPWAELSTSYRLPIDMVGYAREFAQRYLPVDITILPEPAQLELGIDPCYLRWVQAEPEMEADIAAAEILSLLTRSTSAAPSVSDVTLLASSRKMGEEVVARLQRHSIRVLHTFAHESTAAKKFKLAFYMGDARVKATTLHSFKGWESRALVVCGGRMRGADSRALFYTGLTRLKRDASGSWLTVVSTAPELEAFGRTWPSFDRATNEPYTTALGVG